jgi:hypothetical protein
MDQIIAALRDNAVLVNLATFFAGLLLGHRFNVFRDKRIEYNAAISPVREMLLKDRDYPSPMDKYPSIVDIDRIEPYLWRRQRRALGAALDQYAACRKEQLRQNPDTGSVSFADRITSILSRR